MITHDNTHTLQIRNIFLMFVVDRLTDATYKYTMDDLLC